MSSPIELDRRIGDPYRHFVGDDGNGADAPHGTCAKHPLRRRHIAASRDEYRVGAIAEHMVLALAFAMMGVM